MLLLGPPRSPLWEVSSCGRWVRQGRGARLVFQVLFDNRLSGDGQAQHPQAVQWQSACVSFAPMFRNAACTVSVPCVDAYLVDAGHKQGQQPYLVGPWCEVFVDPCVWACGPSLPLSAFTAKTARLRLVHLRMQRADPSFIPSSGVKPAAWRDGAQSGVAAWEQRMVAAFVRKASGCGPLASDASRVRPREELPLYEEPWLHQLVERQHPLVRAQVRLQAQPASTGQHRQDDTVDGLVRGSSDKPWRRAYSGLWQAPRLPRELRYFGWQLLHRALPCGAWRAAVLERQHPELDQQCLCGAATCSYQDRTLTQRCASLETYTHAFLECPVVRPAVQWLTALVAAFDGMAPVITVESLVVGDHTVWMPVSGEEAFGLWQHVRLAFVFAVWELRCCRTSTHRPFSAADVVARCTAMLTAAMTADWMRVDKDVRRVLGVSASWFVGRDPSLSAHEFVSRWCVRDVLAHVSTDGLTMHMHVPPFVQGHGLVV